MTKVCSKTAIWVFVLILTVPASVISAEDPPSAQDQVVRETQPVAAMPVPPALHQALARPLAEAASMGAKAIPTPPAGTWGIVSEGDGGGGIFRDSDTEAEAWLGSDRYGVRGFGESAGAFFRSTTLSGIAYAGYGDNGIVAEGNTAGGHFEDSDSSGYAYVGYGDRGIHALGTEMGGYFQDGDATGASYVGYGNYGIYALGSYSGGYFKDSDSSGYAYVGFGNRGIQALGTDMGGYFKDSDNSGYANVGVGNVGIQAFGTFRGGYFEDTNGTGYAYAGYADYGIWGVGNAMGAYFSDRDGSGRVYAGYGDYGIQASGNSAGGYFFDPGQSGHAYVGYADYGIRGFGDFTGAYFKDLNSSSYAYVASGASKILGSGAVSFIQNHPYDPLSVIVYAAPEGDEVATYTRGTARLIAGEATVPLGETFKWVTNPDLGLTAFLTPVSEWCDLYVVEQATDSIVVRSRDGSDCSFNYMVYGLRIGFEESSIVQEKKQESFIPSMADHRQLYERRPDLMSYNSMERFKGMHHAIDPKAKLDLSRAEALRDAIIEFDPAVHELPGLPRPEEMTREDAAARNEGLGEAVQSGERVRTARADHDRRLPPDHPDISATIPVDDDGNVYATSFRPSSQDLASFVNVSEEVQPGDVLVVDPDRRGVMRRGTRAADNGVVGIVAAAPGLVPGSEFEIGDTKAPDQRDQTPDFQLKAPVAFSGVVDCKVDASYGAVWTGDLLVTSPTPGHAMAQQAPFPGTVLGKALEPLKEGVGTIKVLVMLR